MADAKTPDKKRASFTRTEKPIYAVITYTNSDGEKVKLNKASLEITLERDAGKILDLAENSDGTAIFVKLDMPKAAAKPAAAPEAPAS